MNGEVTTVAGDARGRWIGWALAGLAAAVGIVALSRWAPGSDPATTVCLLRRTTGVPCPGCGMGRAAAALARGDVVDALRFHPLVVLLASEIAAGWALWGLTLAGYLRAPGSRFWGALIGAHVALFLGLWLVRVWA